MGKKRESRLEVQIDDKARARTEARKQQRREFYARNAERLREKSRAKMAEKRHDGNKIASQALAQMLKVKTTTLQSSSARADIAKENEVNEAAVDREIAALVEQGKFSSDNGDSDADNEISLSMIGADVSTDRTERVMQCKSPNWRQSLKWRLPTPVENSPSPEPEGRLPSLYDKLFQ
ncbi:hypothetical protein MSAN_00585100 [Mycena sanguinolenta]|uniref:Uncharacterized protein n=1 Tax=Mycena sanguinolenta TaxID=230812 RepID=A0A8H6Z722_9AGAR|nr:hypothetical protein MSAN_00585100 [Mycena sanguinolenta]